MKRKTEQQKYDELQFWISAKNTENADNSQNVVHPKMDKVYNQQTTSQTLSNIISSQSEVPSFMNNVHQKVELLKQLLQDPELMSAMQGQTLSDLGELTGKSTAYPGKQTSNIIYEESKDSEQFEFENEEQKSKGQMDNQVAKRNSNSKYQMIEKKQSKQSLGNAVSIQQGVKNASDSILQKVEQRPSVSKKFSTNMNLTGANRDSLILSNQFQFQEELKMGESLNNQQQPIERLQSKIPQGDFNLFGKQTTNPDSDSQMRLPQTKNSTNNLQNAPRMSFMQYNMTPKLGGKQSSNDLSTFSQVRASFSRPQLNQEQRQSIFGGFQQQQEMLQAHPSVDDLMSMMREMKEMVRDVTKLAEAQQKLFTSQQKRQEFNSGISEKSNSTTQGDSPVKKQKRKVLIEKRRSKSLTGMEFQAQQKKEQEQARKSQKKEKTSLKSSGIIRISRGDDQQTILLTKGTQKLVLRPTQENAKRPPKQVQRSLKSETPQILIEMVESQSKRASKQFRDESESSEAESFDLEKSQEKVDIKPPGSSQSKARGQARKPSISLKEALIEPKQLAKLRGRRPSLIIDVPYHHSFWHQQPKSPDNISKVSNNVKKDGGQNNPLTRSQKSFITTKTVTRINQRDQLKQTIIADSGQGRMYNPAHKETKKTQKQVFAHGIMSKFLTQRPHKVSTTQSTQQPQNKEQKSPIPLHRGDSKTSYILTKRTIIEPANQPNVVVSPPNAKPPKGKKKPKGAKRFDDFQKAGRQQTSNNLQDVNEVDSSVDSSIFYDQHH
ncbi:hypothetical protein FGO68_gene8387 [Halteria grandinella]|uniref:Uncharacterized protein n=1 Tax=Halteria grandinella TaxID=5974 RepID=A0A8J8SXN2_HALGN|nr:hypothetical protein FGO68_gene8387 [Halteria grandinella]